MVYCNTEWGTYGILAPVSPAYGVFIVILTVEFESQICSDFFSNLG